jgi:hypothetical protein
MKDQREVHGGDLAEGVRFRPEYGSEARGHFEEFGPEIQIDEMIPAFDFRKDRIFTHKKVCSGEKT